MAENRPHLSSFKDRHGKLRWRYRRGKKTLAIPGHPGEERFEAAYTAALTGQPIARTATVVRFKGALPKSLRAAWQILISETEEWKMLAPESRANQTAIAERFLTAKVSENDEATFGDLPVPDLRRRHIKAVLARWGDTPHAAAHILRLIRKLTGVALDQEWIENDPTYRIKFRPGYKGHKAWPLPVRQKFEARWKPSSTPRLVYALALYFGHRRSDVADARWTDLESKIGSDTTQNKTGKSLWIPIHPELELVLRATARRGETIAVTEYGHAFSKKSLTGRMRDWTAAAGIEPGYTIHGLRKTLGKMLAEGGATTRQIMAILGHDDIKHAELYTREAEQRMLAKKGMSKIARAGLRTIKGGKK